MQWLFPHTQKFALGLFQDAGVIAHLRSTLLPVQYQISSVIVNREQAFNCFVNKAPWIDPVMPEYYCIQSDLYRVPTFLHSQNSRIFQNFIQNSRYNCLFFNVDSTHNWVSVYTLYITSTLFCLHYPKVCIPPLTATHNDLYHFERWVLIKKTQINDLMAAK